MTIAATAPISDIGLGDLVAAGAAASRQESPEADACPMLSGARGPKLSRTQSRPTVELGHCNTQYSLCHPRPGIVQPETASLPESAQCFVSRRQASGVPIANVRVPIHSDINRRTRAANDLSRDQDAAV